MKNKNLLQACLGLSFAVLASCSQPATVKTPSARPATNSQSSPKPEREERLVIAYDGEDGKTALELLKARARIRTSTFQFNDRLSELVIEINGIASGNGFDFLYFVNGATVKAAAGNYVTKKSEKVEWKLIGARKQ